MHVRKIKIELSDPPIGRPLRYAAEFAQQIVQAAMHHYYDPDLSLDVEVSFKFNDMVYTEYGRFVGGETKPNYANVKLKEVGFCVSLSKQCEFGGQVMPVGTKVMIKNVNRVAKTLLVQPLRSTAIFWISEDSVE